MLGHGLVTFNPKNLAGLKLWLDAANPSNNGIWPANGSSLSTWVDVSGNGNTATVFSAGIPTFNTNIKNNLPGILFNGAETYSIPQTTQLDFTSGMTVFMIANQTVGSQYNIIFQKRLSGGNFGWQLLLVNQAANGVGIQDNTNPGGAFSNTLWSTSTVYLWCWNLSSSGTNYYQNSSNIYTSAINNLPNTTVSGATYLGSSLNTSNWLTGYIHELLCYNVSLSLSQMTLINDYLRRKWAIY